MDRTITFDAASDQWAKKAATTLVGTLALEGPDRFRTVLATAFDDAASGGPDVKDQRLGNLIEILAAALAVDTTISTIARAEREAPGAA